MRKARPVAGLLAWYDRHRRRLPWRALPGEAADPYRVWLSEIMLQQTTVTAVAPYYAKFLARFPTVEALAAADIDEVLKLWAGLGYYARARHLHACAQAVVACHGGAFPAAEDELAALPGIGPYTAAAVAAIAFDRPASPVDGNVERVIARLYAIEDELPGAKPAIRALAERLRPPQRPGDFAQAMMDLGATICTPKNPACALCPFTRRLRRAPPRRSRDVSAQGEEARRQAAPRRRLRGAAGRRPSPGADAAGARPARRHDRGTDDGVRRRFRRGGGARRGAGPWPRRPGARATRWRRLPGAVTHVFTHFPLELVVFRAEVPGTAAAPDGMRWIACRRKSPARRFRA